MIGQTQKHPEWRELVDLFRDLPFGTLVKHDELAGLVGLVPGTRRYYQQMAQAAKALSRDHSIEIAPVAGVGYERLPANRYGERGRQRLHRAKVQTRRGAWAITNGVTHAHLLKTPEEKADLEKHMRLLDALQRQQRQVLRSMRSLLPPVTPKTDDTTAH